MIFTGKQFFQITHHSWFKLCKLWVDAKQIQPKNWYENACWYTLDDMRKNIKMDVFLMYFNQINGLRSFKSLFWTLNSFNRGTYFAQCLRLQMAASRLRRKDVLDPTNRKIQYSGHLYYLFISWYHCFKFCVSKAYTKVHWWRSMYTLTDKFQHDD